MYDRSPLPILQRQHPQGEQRRSRKDVDAHPVKQFQSLRVKIILPIRRLRPGARLGDERRAAEEKP